MLIFQMIAVAFIFGLGIFIGGFESEPVEQKSKVESSSSELNNSGGKQISISGPTEVTQDKEYTWAITTEGYENVTYLVDWWPANPAGAGLAWPYNRLDEGFITEYATKEISKTFPDIPLGEHRFTVYLSSPQLKDDLEAGLINNLPQYSFQYEIISN